MKQYFTYAFICISMLSGCQEKTQPDSDTPETTNNRDPEIIVAKSCNHNPVYKILRIYPESLKQLQSMEQDSTIIIFHYCSSSDADKPSAVHCYPTEDHLVCDAEKASAIDLYPLDVYWPIEKIIPDSYRYLVFGQVSIPDNSSSPDPEERGVSAQQPLYVNGQVRAYDNRLNQYKPVEKAWIQYYSIQSGSPVLTLTATDSLGNFRLQKPDTIRPVNLQLQNSHFTVREGNTSTVKSYYLGTVGFLFGGTIYLQCDLPSDFYLDVYQAASYYFYKNNSLLNQVQKYDSLSSMSIYAVNAFNQQNPDIHGVFSSGSTQNITIYNYCNNDYTGAASKIFGTVLHELGHATHLYNIGGYSFGGTQEIIRESFASFFGWYNVLTYYSSVISDHASVNSICEEGRQDWEESDFPYTPFYVDLFDNYNQNLSNPLWNNDTVSDMSLSYIVDLSLWQTSFQSVYNLLASSISPQFSYEEFNVFTSPYLRFL